jgi:hypothetical protein
MGLYPELDGRVIYLYNGNLYPDSSTYQVPGLRFACLPFNALEQGTLECLFDSNCLGLLWSVKPAGSPPSPLTMSNINSSSRFMPKSTIASIIDQLFLEQWESQNVSYADFFRQCQPIICTYSSVSRGNIVYVITTLISLLGGLSTILKLLVPFLVKLYRAISKKISSPVTLRTVRSISQGIVSLRMMSKTFLKVSFSNVFNSN